MKFVSQITLFKLLKFLKWGKIFAKLIAISVTISGAVATLSGYAILGIDVSALGAIIYIATYGLPGPRYEKTRHVPPARINKIANMMRFQEVHSMIGQQTFKKSVTLFKSNNQKQP